MLRDTKSNQIVLYSKGADSVLMDPVRLASEERDKKDDYDNLQAKL